MKKLFSKTVTTAAILASLCLPSIAQPSLTAKAWLVADGDGKMIEGDHTTDVRSIASITKLMTVMVALDTNQPLDEVISTKLYNKQLTRRELISLAIIKSDNNAARILCENHINGYDGCIQAMNFKAWSLDMKDTHYIEPTGLSIFNVSTAQDLVKLVMAASQYAVIKEDSNTDSIKMKVGKKSTAFFHNTNTLVGKGYDFIVSKTGWITKSGGCIVMMLTTERGIRTVVLLGSKNTKTRIPEAKQIALTY
jgi:serine-type D-Ala-D-Ala endopeptidase (penicillin-binding protein 7)